MVPAAPSLTAVTPCNGYNDVEWTASSGVTSYELWGSPYSNFTPQYRYYSGPNTFVTINFGAGNTYLHVRACNANGCSAFSNSGLASYSRGCSR